MAECNKMLPHKLIFPAICIAAISSSSTLAQGRPEIDSANTGLVVLDQVDWSQSVTHPRVDDAQRLLITVPHPFRLGASESYYYSLTSVPIEDLEATLQRLDSLRRTNFYACILDEEPEKRSCYYSRNIDLSKGRFTQSLEDVHYTEMSDEQKDVFEWARNLSLAEIADSTNHPNFSTWRHLLTVTTTTNDDGTRVTESYVPELSFQYGDTANESILFPFDWYQVLVNEKPEQLWVECQVRVDSSGLPITDPNFECRPIAISSERALYLAIERMEPPFGGGYFINIVSGQAFDLASVADPENAATRIMEVFTRQLIQRFSDHPVGAEIDRSEILPPRELLFRRDFQSSLVLNSWFRGPYFERSAYLFRWWCGQILGVYVDPLSDCASYSPGIIITLHHSLQISSEQNGDYPDASNQQQAEYERVIQSIISDTVRTTTELLGGEMRDQVGVFVGEVR